MVNLKKHIQLIQKEDARWGETCSKEERIERFRRRRNFHLDLEKRLYEKERNTYAAAYEFVILMIRLEED